MSFPVAFTLLSADSIVAGAIVIITPKEHWLRMGWRNGESICSFGKTHM
jgi:hypothetical protein